MQPNKLLLRILVISSMALAFAGDALSDDQDRRITAASVKAWADKEIGSAVAEHRLAAAAISVVKDGKLLFMRGYGYADYANRIPMDPASSKVRICSQSKLFTATALMQLVERGQIASLDDDANRYLKRLVLPDYNGRAVSIRDLTTHRGGFEDSYFNAGTTVEVDTPVSADLLVRLIPEQVREPGVTSVYSNANSAIQGVLIEDITGMPLREYLMENIISPLGMSNSLLNDNPPAPAGRVYSQIFFKDGSVQQVELVAKHPVYAPSGGMFSTALDMSRFLLAHLNGGSNNHGTILLAETVRLMQQPATRNHPALGALGVQFYIEDLAGERVISHGCGMPGFTSHSLLLPDRNVAMFVSVAASSETLSVLEKLKHWINGTKSQAIHPRRAAEYYYQFLRQFVGFPDQQIRQQFEDNLKLYTGIYKVERRTHSNMLKLIELLSPASFMMYVDLHENGGLSINGSKPYRAFAAHVFQGGNHPANVIAFGVHDGQATALYRSTAQVYTRVSAWSDSGRLQSLAIWGVVWSLTALVMFLPGYGSSHACRSVAIAGLVIGLLITAIFLLVSVGFAPGKNIEHYVNEGGKPRLIMIAVSGNLLAVASTILVWFAVKAAELGKTRMSIITVARRIHLLSLAVAASTIIFTLVSTRLVGLQFPWF